MQTKIRPAGPDDADAIAAIYEQGIRAGTATVVSRPPTPEVMLARLVSARPEHAWLVADARGAVVGWAATMPYLDVEEYAGVAEFSVYVALDWQGRGVGRQLMAALMSAAEQAGLYKLTSRVFASNLSSRGMLTRMGFREVGTHRRHVRFTGGWRDVVIVEALIGDARAAVASRDSCRGQPAVGADSSAEPSRRGG